MRTAEQILKDNDISIDKWPDTKMTIIKAINDAREESIYECIGILNPECSESVIKEMLILKNKLK